MFSVLFFQTWCVVNYLAIDFKAITKLELNQALCQFDATATGKENPVVQIDDSMISRSSCLLKILSLSQAAALLLE